MVHTRSNRLLTLSLAVGMAVGSTLMLASPADAQSRFRVLVPKSLARQGNADKGFGEDVSKELSKLIETLPTHAPVEKGELRNALKQFDLKEDDLVNCITARQLAAQRGFELVLCGEYSQTPDGFEIAAEFISPRENETFAVPAFTVVGKDKKQAAQQIFDSFKNYVDMLRYSSFCMDHLSSQQWPEALERCDAALAIEPNAQSALYGRGYALMQLEQYDPAMEALSKLLEINPIHQDALMAAGFLAAKMGRMEESREHYNAYLELNPGNAQVRLKIATDAANAGDPEGALQIAEAGLQGDSVDLTLAEYAGYFAMQAATRAEQAAAEGESEDSVPAEALSLYEKALGYFEQVFAVKADSVQPNVLVSTVNALTKLGRSQEAVDRGSEFVAAQPDNVSLWNVYASALKEVGRLDDALAALDRVSEKDPEQKVRARKGQWLLEAGDLNRAKATFREAIDGGEIEAEQAARMFLAIGVNDKYQNRDLDGALPYLRTVLEFSSVPETQGMAHFFIGYILYVQGEQVQAPSTAASAEKALPMFRQALDHLNQAGPYAETNASVAQNLRQLLGAVNQYIEIQEALIKRGR